MMTTPQVAAEKTTSATTTTTMTTTTTTTATMKKSPSGGASDSHHLFDAVTKGKIHLTRFILAASNSHLANAWDQDGRTPLIACCDIKEEGTRDQIVQILLEGGADVNMMDREGRSPLIHACEKRCNDIVRLLIHHHKIKPDMEDQYGNTALIYSAGVGNDVATELLTRNFRRLGLQVDHYNKQGNTALHVATKNGNLNCAKILAQKGRASVSLKDKEQGMTPLEWCLRKGFEKDEVDFLKPNTRFYRVAKLATSLSKSRSSVGSLSLDAKSKVSPTKSADSGSSSNAKGRAKITLSRSKSHAVESNPQGKAGGVFRQSTMDGATGSHRHSAPRRFSGKLAANITSFASGKKPKEAKGCKESKETGKASKKMNTTDGSVPADPVPGRSAPNSNLIEVNAADEHTKASSMKISQKYISGIQGAPIKIPVQSVNLQDDSEDAVPASSRPGRVTGLGCSLSITSMQSLTTSLGSSDCRSVDSPSSSGPDEYPTVISDFYDSKINVSLVTSTNTMGTNAGYVSNGQNVGSSVSPYLDGTIQSDRSDAVEVSTSENPTFSQDSGPSDGSSHTAAQGKSTASKADTRRLKRNPSLRDIDCEEIPSDTADGFGDLTPYQESSMPQSLTRLSEEEDSMASADQRSDDGQSPRGVLTSPLPTITDCGLQSSPASQDSAIISHMRGTLQISQDA
ncbi:uncharacterized protein LOC143296155 [Babylonia areolata]|uniref:uncharacterized protein LOC143296155 n=1 Tax=Babylonia areolata TaxID=304850 RepID=UPI003FCF52DD